MFLKVYRVLFSLLFSFPFLKNFYTSFKAEYGRPCQEFCVSGDRVPYTIRCLAVFCKYSVSNGTKKNTDSIPGNSQRTRGGWSTCWEKVKLVTVDS